MLNLLSIEEAAELAGKSARTIYRYVRQKKLKYQRVSGNVKNKDNVKIAKSDLEILLGKSFDTCQTKSNNDMTSENVKTSAQSIPELVKSAIEEVLSGEKLQLMKPLEQQALYIAGKLQNENDFLRQRIETIRQENEDLQERMKLLPAPPEELVRKLQAETDRAEQAEKHAQEAQEAVKQAERDKEALSGELDQMKDSAGIWQAQAAKLEEELQNERARPWWKKLFGR